MELEFITQDLQSKILDILDKGSIRSISIIVAFITKQGAEKFTAWIESRPSIDSVRLLFSTYLDFTDPQAISHLLSSSIELRRFPIELGKSRCLIVLT